MTASRRSFARQVAGFVLAGGRSSRMGSDKALLELGGLPLVVRAVRELQALAQPVTVIGPAEIFRGLHLSILADDYPGAGPLGGIATALAHTGKPWNLVLAADMPYLTAKWLGHLTQLALASSADVVLPESDYTGQAMPEPLCALYHQRGLRPIRAALQRGARKVMDGLASLNIEHITPAESKPFDSEGLLFQNLNTKEDYKAARERFDRMHKERD